MDVAAEITATEFSEVIRTHFGLLYLFFFYAVAAALTSICARQNKRKIYGELRLSVKVSTKSTPKSKSGISTCLNRSMNSSFHRLKSLETIDHAR